MEEKFMKNFNGEKIFCLEYDKETLKDMVFDLQDRINKAIRHLEILLEITKEQDSENVNLIDRLEGILNILKGE